MLKLNSVSKTFAPGTVNEKKALDNVTLHLAPGDFVTVLGSNGAGKSTLFNAIAGTFLPDCGTIALDGQDITKLPDYKRSKYIASDLISFGFNLDLAPVADVWSNPDNTVIGDRAYSTDFALAADLVAAAVEGFHAGGAACTLKHFPGHGDTSADSHYGAVYVDKSLDELRTQELLPFRSGIQAGADMVMMGHLILSDIDSAPAPFSHEIVTGLLREELGFDGVVITDSLEMSAVSDYFTSGEIAVKCIQAGVDLLLCPADLDQAVTALTDAVESGEISEERINESVLRILELKLRQGILL